MSQLLIALGGVARVGKNTFANILENRLKFNYQKTSKQFALANELKRDCESFIKDKMHLDVWTDNTEEKELFRPILVSYGNVKRVQTQGTYWTSLLEKQIKECYSDVVIVTDVRYDLFEKDEVSWVKDKMKGKLVHLSKFLTKDGISIQFNDSNPTLLYTQPANDHETQNDPKVKAKADYVIEWEDQTRYYKGNLVDNLYMNNVVDSFIKGLIKDGLL